VRRTKNGGAPCEEKIHLLTIDSIARYYCGDNEKAGHDVDVRWSEEAVAGMRFCVLDAPPLNRKQLETLASIFQDRVRSDIAWRDAESLLRALGAEITEGKGSRVRIALHGRKATFHEPHPRKEMVKGAVRSLRSFLMSAGVQP
jgi:HicA toxin of bacterial toxin-antitoxin,